MHNGSLLNSHLQSAKTQPYSTTIVRPQKSTVETQPQLQPALLRLSATISQYFTKPSNDVSGHHQIFKRAGLVRGIVSLYRSINGPHVTGTLPPTTGPTSRRPTPERYTKNAASCLGPVCMLSTKLLVPGAGDAHVHPRGAGDNKARFFLTRRLPAPLAQWRLAPAAKFYLHWSAKANLEKDGNGHLSHRNNRT